MTKLPSLSVFFPVYNEAPNLPTLIEQALTKLPRVAKQFEVIIVNDGSNDSTTKIVSRAKRQDPRLRLVTHPKNLGYGAALKTGIAAAQYEWTFWTDGDLQFDLTSLEQFLNGAQTHAAVIGYRKHRADTFIRKVNGELYTRLINFLFQLKVRDIDCAFKLIKTQELQKLVIGSSGAFTSAEILIRLHKNGVKFKQVPVPHFKRQHGTPTGGSVRVIFKGLKETIQFYLMQ